MILVDSSAWVAFDRATGSEVNRRVRDLLESDDVAVTEPVIAEVCIGARSDRRELDLRRLLARGTSLAFDPAADFDGAVRIYRACRRAGVTPRGLVDCMIANVALRHDVAVLADDADFARLADVVLLRLDLGSQS